VRVSLPTDAPAAAQDHTRWLGQLWSATPTHVALDRLQASLAAGRGDPPARATVLDDAAPLVLVSRTPALLIRADGAPVMRPIGSTGLLRVVNTPALVVFAPQAHAYFLFVGDMWLKAPALGGPWHGAALWPPALDQERRRLEARGGVDTFADDAKLLARMR